MFLSLFFLGGGGGCILFFCCFLCLFVCLLRLFGAVVSGEPTWASNTVVQGKPLPGIGQRSPIVRFVFALHLCLNRLTCWERST